jgi:hypothetical protein
MLRQPGDHSHKSRNSAALQRTELPQRNADLICLVLDPIQQDRNSTRPAGSQDAHRNPFLGRNPPGYPQIETHLVKKSILVAEGLYLTLIKAFDT